MEPSIADKDLTGTNVHSGEEYVSESPLDNATEINENGQNIAYSENTTIESNVNTGGDVNGIEVASTSDRPRRNAKPSGKSIENTSQTEHTKLDKAWTKVQRAVTTLQNAPNSIDEIVKAIAQVRAEYNAYDNLHYNFANFLTHVGTRECMEELHKLAMSSEFNKEFVLENIEQGNQRKQEVMFEIKSMRSGSGSRASSTSSTALRAKARAEVAVAIKKAEIYKKRSLAESQSAFNIQREELALAKRKLEEQTRLEALRLEDDAAIAVARAKAIDDELGFDISHEQNPIDLPVENPQTRVQQFIDDQDLQPQTNDPEPTSRDTGNTQQTPSHDLRPTSQPFTPTNCPTATNSDQNVMRSCLEFMARREVLTKRVEKFDDDPQNFHTWKTSFKTMLKDITITPQEELSLLTEYTSKESRKLVQKLRNAYIQNPAKGVVEVWVKLGERFGSDVVLTKAYLDKIGSFPKVGYRDNKTLQELGDLLLSLQCAKDDGQLKGLRILDEPIFLRPIIEKLPNDIQSRWQRHAFRYKREKHTEYPPFSEFSKFVQDVSLERNDPNLVIERPTNDNPPPQRSKPRQTFRTDIKESDHNDDSRDVNLYNPDKCVLHGKSHPVTSCRAFRAKSIEERKSLVRKHRLCFRCLASVSHMAKDCKFPVKCSECGSDRHLAALHVDQLPKPPNSGTDHGGEKSDDQKPPDNVAASCTEICAGKPGGRSCSKICLANVFSEERPERKIKVYVVIDDQSNCSLAKPELFDRLGKNGPRHPYTLKTCAGTTLTEGRYANNLFIESTDGSKCYSLPTVTECTAIPDNKNEIPTPDIARAYPHLRPIAGHIPEIDENASILLLIGRDAPPLHKVRESRNGRGNMPWAQRLDLGWVVLGNTCLDGVHQPTTLSTFTTNVLQASIFEPCPNKFEVNTAHESNHTHGTETVHSQECFIHGRFNDGLGVNVFQRTDLDNKPGLSVEDRIFVDMMNAKVKKNEFGNWTAPLPLRNQVTQLPDSYNEALKRLKSTRKTLDRKPGMKDHYFSFMQKILDNNHAERVPANEVHTLQPKWYLPHFGIYHPQKPNKIRIVFDSAAEVEGVSLNKMLLSGPDLANSLLGVLMRFRQHGTAFMADIEQMFHSFHVEPKHRDYLRFLWYEGNNPDGKIVEYRMNVHLFGNTSSPAVATFCLRKTAQEAEAQFGSDAREFVEKDFYVDDGLKSLPGPEESVDLLKRTQSMLATANLRLHKVASNDPKVTEAFSSSDRATDCCNLDLNENTRHVQRSLGVYWGLKSDTFSFKVSEEMKPFTRRGVLSVINSLFDPLGIAAPVVIKGKMLLRQMTWHLKNNHPGEWDQPLPNEFYPPWIEWFTSLSALQEVEVPRCYSTIPLDEALLIELHVFGDASELGIAAVSYLRSVDNTGTVTVSFVFGKAKLAPSHATTMPRLELCAAVLAVEIAELIQRETVFPPCSIIYHSDSKVVLGYIRNQTRRFYVYVSNRVEIIRRSTSPEDWRYVPTHLNPADCATRSVKAINLTTSQWLTGPNFLRDGEELVPSEVSNSVEITEEDPEVRPVVKAFATEKPTNRGLESTRFVRFSHWPNLVAGLAALISKARSLRLVKVPNTTDSESDSVGKLGSAVSLRKQAENLIIRTVQHVAFADEVELITKQKVLPKGSPLTKLNPIVDESGILRVGGRLSRADLSDKERHPVILPGSHHVTTLLVKLCHQQTKHQGRHFTRGRIRAAGYWIIGEKRLVNRIIHECVSCRKLRGRLAYQKMADLPSERLTPAPPFTYVGLDVFGPWQVVTRRTRGGVAKNKRWAVIFTCLTIRAVHIEIIEAMDTSSFLNALRRFLALRGPVSQFRSDCGTNFVGAQTELATALREMKNEQISSYLAQQECQWLFNPPHASHAGGIWERMIGMARKILDAMLHELPTKQLTHEVLTTLMAEVSAIMNSRPLTPVSTDPEAPEILSPSMILTQKTSPLPPPPGKFTPKDLHAAQWRQVQYLANVFWARWKREFLPLLQVRRKWTQDQPNLRIGDLVLLKDKEISRNEWPIAMITKVFPSEDGKVRKIEVTTAREGSKRCYDRPVTEVVLIISTDELNKEH